MKEAMKEAMREIEEETGKGSISSPEKKLKESSPSPINTSTAGSGTITDTEVLTVKEEIKEAVKVDVVSVPFFEEIKEALKDTSAAGSGAITKKESPAAQAEEIKKDDYVNSQSKLTPEGSRQGSEGNETIDIELLKTLKSLNTTLRVSIFILILIWLIKTLWEV